MKKSLWSAAAAWAALSVSTASSARGQGVTLVDDPANSRAWMQLQIPVPDLTYAPQWTSIAPISFDLAVAGLSEGGNTAMYSATRIVQQDQTITQIRFVPIMEADGTVPNPSPFDFAYANVDIRIRFTTPVPGPAFFLSGAIAAQLAGDPSCPNCGVLPRFRMYAGLVKVSNGAPAVDISSPVDCPGNLSCVLLDTNAAGFFAGSLQGGEIYELSIIVIGTSAEGSYSSVVAPAPATEPFLQIDFTQSFDRQCADQNQDGQVTAADFNTWILNYNANSLLADVNQDMMLTPADFNAWIGAYNLGLAGPYCVP